MKLVTGNKSFLLHEIDIARFEIHNRGVAEDSGLVGCDATSLRELMLEDFNL
jgi:hypothetical protein